MKNSLFLLSFLTASATAWSQDFTDSTFTLDPDAVTNLRLEYSPVARAGIRRNFRATGTIQLDEKRVYDVTPRIDGVVVSDETSLGDSVAEGDILFRLQSAELSEMISNYVTAEDAMTFAVAAVDQERKLAEKNLSSAEQLRERELQMRQALADHARALQPLRILDFDENTIHVFLANSQEADYTRLEIRAAGSGEIVSKALRRGAAVQHDEHLFTIADLSELWVDFQVALRDIPHLSVGDRVLVESTVTEKSREAEVVYISPLADELSRTVMVRATMQNSDRAWRPGNPVSVAGADDPAETAIVVPTRALVDLDGGKSIFVLRGVGEFAGVPVEIGESDGEATEIVSGLSGDETVVSRNAAQLKGHLEMTAE